MRDNRGKHPGFPQRGSDTGTVHHLGNGVLDALFHDPVQDNGLHDSHGIYDRHSRTEQRTECPGKPGNGYLLVYRAVDRHPHPDTVELHGPFLRPLPSGRQIDACPRNKENKPPGSAQEIARSDKDPRGKRKHLVHVLEHAYHPRDHGGKEKQEHDHGYKKEHDGIDERGTDLGTQPVLPLHEFCQPQKDNIQGAADFTGAHHIDIQFGEDPPVLGKRIGKGHTFVDAVAHLGNSPLHTRGFGLFVQGTQRIYEGDGSSDKC